MFIPLKDENPTSRFPYITVFFIALNILIFLYQFFSPQGLQYYVFKIDSQEPVSRLLPPLALMASMFLHGGFLHLFGNMLYLWIFGNNIEDFLGSFRFIFFYLLSGLGASLTHIVFHPNSQVPMIGASGAIAGVLGAYLILYPRARVLSFVFLFFFIRILPVPAFFLLGIWFIAQVLNVGLGGGVAWFAHIGGFLIGIALIKIYTRKRRKVKSWVH